MVKGQIVSGDFSKIAMRVKADCIVELGELVVVDNPDEKFILQIYDLTYGSQISQQNLEMVAGMNLEEGSFTIMDQKLRNYQLALLKPILNFSRSTKTCKKLPSFFSQVREITEQDLSFITKPEHPFFLGKLRSGSKEMDFNIYLPGKDVLSHHVLIPASTGKGKSLDGNEDVLVKQNGIFSIKSIAEIVDNHIFSDSELQVMSMNPKNYSIDFKKVTDFVRHKAPKSMFSVLTKSGREVLVTGDHNLHVLRNGNLVLLKTEEILNTDHLPFPTVINQKGNIKELNLFELFKNEEQIYVIMNSGLLNKIKSKNQCIQILSNYFTRPSQKYNSFIKGRERIKIKQFNELLQKDLTYEDLSTLEVTDYNTSLILKCIFPLTKDFLQLLGYYIAEGYCQNDNSFRISCSEETNQRLLNKILQKSRLGHFWVQKKGVNVDMGVSSSIYTKILRHLGVGRISGEKKLPGFFMSLPKEKLSILLRTYFEGDGGVDMVKDLKKRNFMISTTTKSKKLASDLSYALLRFGIFCRIKKTWKRATNTNHKGNWYYRIKVSGKSDMQKFLSEIGFQFERKNNVLKDKFDYRENTNVDLIPVDPKIFRKKRLEIGLSQKEFAMELGYSYSMVSAVELGKRRPSRTFFTQVLLKFENFQDLKYLTNFRWDQIKEITKIEYKEKYVYDLTVKDNHTFLAGHGGIFVHNSNLMSCILWDNVDKQYSGLLVLDPHDEYYGRNGLGLKDHPSKNISYYTPINPPPGARTLKINVRKLKPEHFNGAITLSDPQRQCFHAYYKKFRENWVEAIIREHKIEGVRFHEDTMAVVKRKLIQLLNIEMNDLDISCSGIFDNVAGENTVAEICQDLENSKIVIIDTSFFSGAIEILVGSLITSEVFSKYRYYKRTGRLNEKPVISIVLEEAPRVLGKKVLEQGSNVFDSIAREGRKFKIGLIAITQLPSEIPKNILANMNTKIILGIEMNSERQAVIESSPQDLSQDNRNIASLDKGEALVTSTFTRFAVPIKVPLFKEFAKKEEEKVVNSYVGFG